MTEKKITFNKLVRDRIPQIISDSGGKCHTRTLNDEEYKAALIEKAKEEIDELKAASPEYTTEEAADLLQVLKDYVKSCGITMEAVESVRVDKETKRGGFSQRVFLEWATEMDKHPNK